MSITFQQARHAIEAAIVECERMEVAASLAVVDLRGDLVAAARMDGARWGWTADVARGKALAAALWGQPGAMLEQRQHEPVPLMVSRLYGERLVYRQGSELLMQGSEVVGAIGVSGARPEQDERAAQAGVAALAAS